MNAKYVVKNLKNNIAIMTKKLYTLYSAKEEEPRIVQTKQFLMASTMR